MKKSVLIFIFGLLIFQTAKAQKDTLLYYMKNPHQIVTNKDSAKYFLFIMPPDTVNGIRLYPVKEFYPNGKTKMVGASTLPKYNALKLEDSCISFYDNGARKSVTNYKDGRLAGDVILYYPNGKLYAVEFVRDGQWFLVECRDSTGNVLAENGNGKWVLYDEDLKNKKQEGPVKDSLLEGEWHEIINDSAKYVVVYHKSVFVSTTDTLPERQPLFSKAEKDPEFPGGMKKLNTFIEKNLVYPTTDKENNVKGTVLVSFIVEINGSLTHLKAKNAPSKSLDDAAINVIKASAPWKPGMIGVKLVRCEYTVPVSFNLSR